MTPTTVCGVSSMKITSPRTAGLLLNLRSQSLSLRMTTSGAATESSSSEWRRPVWTSKPSIGSMLEDAYTVLTRSVSPSVVAKNALFVL
jgi:hypothetical protein